MAFNKTISAGLVKALTEENEEHPRGLRALNSTLFTFTGEQLGKVLKTQKKVMVLNVTMEVEPGETSKKELLSALEGCASLEQVEVVANPSLQFFMEVCLFKRCSLDTRAFLVPLFIATFVHYRDSFADTRYRYRTLALV